MALRIYLDSHAKSEHLFPSQKSHHQSTSTKFSTFVSMSAVSSFETESSRKLIPVGLIKPMLLLIVLRSVTKSVVHCNELVSYLDASVCQCIEGSGVTYVDLCFERDCHVRTCDLSC